MVNEREKIDVMPYFRLKCLMEIIQKLLIYTDLCVCNFQVCTLNYQVELQAS